MKFWRHDTQYINTCNNNTKHQSCQCDNTHHNDAQYGNMRRYDTRRNIKKCDSYGPFTRPISEADFILSQHIWKTRLFFFLIQTHQLIAKSDSRVNEPLIQTALRFYDVVG